jgi:anthranilate synthase component 1
MAAGLYGYLSYDMVRLMELAGRIPTRSAPEAILPRPTIAPRQRRGLGTGDAGRPTSGLDARAAYSQARALATSPISTAAPQSARRRRRSAELPEPTSM